LGGNPDARHARGLNHRSKACATSAQPASRQQSKTENFAPAETNSHAITTKDESMTQIETAAATNDQSPLTEMERIMGRIFAQQAHNRETAPEILNRALGALRACLTPEGITRIEMRYDGFGDDGQVEDVELYRGDTPLSPDDALFGMQLEVPTYQRYGEEGEGTIKGSVREVLDYLAMDIIDIEHDGYENDDGGYGTILIDLTAVADSETAAINHEHNQRIEQVDTSHHSYGR